MTSDSAEIPQDALAEDYREDFRVELDAGAPELTRVLFARDPSVVPPEDYEYELKFNLGMVRPHARHLVVELNAVISNVPWTLRNQIVVSYRTHYLIRGRTSPAAGEAIVLDLARRIAPSALFPFIRETVHSITSKAGSALMLPMVDWGTAFPADLEMPDPQGETPPEFLEAV